jgi:hypothetical protein
MAFDVGDLSTDTLSSVICGRDVFTTGGAQIRL